MTTEMKYKWEKDAASPDDYNVVQCQRGREFILRLTTGADAYLAIQKFAQDHDIQFAKVHAAFMGGFQPAKYLMWTPDTNDPDNWHNETAATVDNLSMVLSLSGIIHLRPNNNGDLEPFPAMHYVLGGGWDVPTAGGHLVEGTIVKGVLAVFITEITGIEVILPSHDRDQQAPENWYKETE
jgi:predicted DNA-binding protein with PD1-like motif